MSKDQAMSFLKHAAQDAELQQKIVALAAQEGYRFTVDELTDAELDAAAGGVLLSQPMIKIDLQATTFPKVESTEIKLDTYR